MNYTKPFLVIGLLMVMILGARMEFCAAQENVILAPTDQPTAPAPQLTAVAGNDKYVVAGRQILFSGSASSAPSNQDVTYTWDFGDGRSAQGVDVTHVYDDPGNYRVTLTVRSGQQMASDEIFVAAGSDVALLITDSSVSYDTIQSLQSKAGTQGIVLVNVHVEESGIDYLVEASLVQAINDNFDNIKQAQNLIVWTKDNIGLNSLIAASQELTKSTSSEKLGFKNKNIVVLTGQGLSATSRLAQNLYNLLTPQALVLTKEQASQAAVSNISVERLLNDLKEQNIQYQLLGVHTQRPLTQLKPWNFLSYIVNYMVNNGVAVNTIYLILILPVIATIIAVARQIIGIKALGLYAPTLVAISFIVMGLQYGLGIFVMVWAIGTLSRLVARKTKILYLPRMAIVLSLVSLSIIALFFMGAYLGKVELVSISVFPILIMVIISERFVAAQIELGGRAALRLVAETLVLSVVCYFLASWETFRVFLLGYPEWVFVTLIINLFLGRWAGLRLFELYRFRKVLKHVQLTEKK